jgi:DNA-binding CsgD family transcriptional regulator
MLEFLETVRLLQEETGILGVQFGVGFPLTKVPSARAHHMLGRDVEPLLTEFEGRGARNVAARSLVLAYLGRCGEATQLIRSVGDLASPDEESWLMSLADLLEASIHCGDVATAAALVPRLSPLAGGLQGYLVSFGRLLGDAATMLGQFEAARGYYRQAVDVCQRVRFRPELALTRLALAELLLNHLHAERAEGLEHLQLAEAELRTMRMQPALERALRLQHAATASTLTAREQEVVALVARGLSNRDIAEALVISEGTAEVHLKHILSKLGFKSRHQVAVWATHDRPAM